ncbi:hypothetical protein FBU30_002942 [Linnemannia zychae]|nr:hypothetical protein FBU30_002942 [Linnemannia zychae]
MTEVQAYFNIFSHVTQPFQTAATELQKFCEYRSGSSKASFDWDKFLDRINNRPNTDLSIASASEDTRVVGHEASAEEVVAAVVDYLSDDMQVTLTDDEVTSLSGAITPVFAKLKKDLSSNKTTAEEESQSSKDDGQVPPQGGDSNAPKPTDIVKGAIMEKKFLRPRTLSSFKIDLRYVKMTVKDSFQAGINEP